MPEIHRKFLQKLPEKRRFFKALFRQGFSACRGADFGFAQRKGGYEADFGARNCAFRLICRKNRRFAVQILRKNA